MSDVNTISISAQEDFLERQCSASPLNALAELVWNGLDSGSDQVDVSLVLNNMDGLEEIHVSDGGSGIQHGHVADLFGKLGDSWKKDTGRLHGRALHGKNGQGRLKAFALGERVTWYTTFSTESGLQAYQVNGRASMLDALTFTNPTTTTASATGTRVVISDIQKSLGPLLSDDAHQELAKVFGAYLSQYPQLSIMYDGKCVDPTVLQNAKREIPLEPIRLANGSEVSASVCVIEWKTKTKRAIHLCDENGVSLHEMEPGVQAPGYYFTAYIKCDHFRELDKINVLTLDDLHPDVDAIVSAGRNAVKTHFRKLAAAKQRQIVQQWKEERIYPYEEKADLTPVEEAERQVFDILGVNLEAYLPKFEEADESSRRFTFRLLAQALRDNPESVQKIISEVLNLKQEAQDDLAALLENTPLSNIISSAQTVANRLDFLVALENLLFDKESKKKLLERDQLHKILEKEAWIFDEEFTLSGSEERLEEVLELHLKMLGERKDDDDDDDPVLREGGMQGRIDLMLSRTVQPRHDEHDHLVVELKRPSQKINSEVLSQVESYAIAVAKDPRFHTERTHWRFIAVSNEMDDHAKRKANQRHQRKGLVFDDPDLNIEVWAFDWTEIIANARARLQFINKSLDYAATRDSAKAYLLKTHEKFIPELEGDDV
jgi:hypothetical protein